MRFRSIQNAHGIDMELIPPKKAGVRLRNIHCSVLLFQKVQIHEDVPQRPASGLWNLQVWFAMNWPSRNVGIPKCQSQRPRMMTAHGGTWASWIKSKDSSHQPHNDSGCCRNRTSGEEVIMMTFFQYIGC